MSQRKIDLLFWGYIANLLQSLLKPYLSGSSFALTADDREIIEQSEKFLDSILKGCDTVNSPGALSFTPTHLEVPSATALHFALEIFSSMSIAFPNNLEEFRQKLSNYRSVLEKLKTSQPVVNDESLVAEEVSSFFKAMSDKADRELYESTYSL